MPRVIFEFCCVSSLQLADSFWWFLSVVSVWNLTKVVKDEGHFLYSAEFCYGLFQIVRSGIHAMYCGGKGEKLISKRVRRGGHLQYFNFIKC